MALTGNITIHGGSAGAVFHDHGAISFAPFTSYSAFLSDQIAFNSSSYTEIDNGSLTLKSKFGNLVATNTDTISAAFGGDTVVGGSVAISFVFDSSTTTLFSTPYSETLTGASGLTTLGSVLGDFSKLEHQLLAPVSQDTVSSAAASIVPTTAPTAGSVVSLGDAKATLVAVPKHTDKA